MSLVHKREIMGDDPPYLAVGTEVSAKYKGAFCEAKIRKVVKSVKCKVLLKQGLGSITVTDDQIKGNLRVGSVVEVKQNDKKDLCEATITKIQDCSQYTVVFDDGDITTLRRTALCLKSGRHFAESETLDQLPLTHPEHFSTPVIGGRRGRRHRTGGEDSSDEEEVEKRGRAREEKEADIGRVVCVEVSEKKKLKDNWFPGLVVAPTAQDTVRIHVKDEYLVRSFKDGRYYTVPKKEATEFTKDIGSKVENHTLRAAVEKALLFMDKSELPPHWDRDLLFGVSEPASDSEQGSDFESGDDEPREEKDHFVAQLFKFMDDRGTPINKGPVISGRDVDLYRLFKVVHNFGGYNKVTNHNHWKTVSHKMGFGQNPNIVNSVKQAYKRFLHSFEEFYRKLGCTMVNHPRMSRNRHRTGRSLLRDREKSISGSVKSESKDKDESEGTTNSPETERPASAAKDRVSPAPPPPPPPPEPIETPGRKSVELKPEPKPEPDPQPQPDNDEESDPPKKPRVLKKKEGPGGAAPLPKKDKKTRLGLTGRRDKVPNKITKPVVKTRQKRVLKERVKAEIEKGKTKAKEVKETKDSPAEPPEPKTKPAKKEEPPEERKKVGRKRKEKTENEDPPDQLPSYKTVMVGDKLRVYYGPTHESKVTYEAKVMNSKGEGADVQYYVHYTGWNTRYDEWIKPTRIADNLSWVPGRTAKKSMSPKVVKKRSLTDEPSPVSTPRRRGVGSNSPGPRSRPMTKKKGREAEASDEEQEAEPYQSDNANDGFPSSRKEDDSKDLPDTPRKKRRRGVETESDKSSDTSGKDRQVKVETDEGEEEVGAGEESEEGKKEEEAESIETQIKEEAEESGDDEEEAEESKDQDDLDEMTELKEVKEEEEDEEEEEEESAEEEEDDEEETKDDEVEEPPPQPSPEAKEPTKEVAPTKEVVKEPVPKEPEEPGEEDIYEFKEPEPFELEVRKEDRLQRRSVNRMFEAIKKPTGELSSPPAPEPPAQPIPEPVVSSPKPQEKQVERPEPPERSPSPDWTKLTELDSQLEIESKSLPSSPAMGEEDELGEDDPGIIEVKKQCQLALESLEEGEMDDSRDIPEPEVKDEVEDEEEDEEEDDEDEEEDKVEDEEEVKLGEEEEEDEEEEEEEDKVEDEEEDKLEDEDEEEEDKIEEDELEPEPQEKEVKPEDPPPITLPSAPNPTIASLLCEESIPGSPPPQQPLELPSDKDSTKSDPMSAPGSPASSLGSPMSSLSSPRSSPSSKSRQSIERQPVLPAPRPSSPPPTPPPQKRPRRRKPSSDEPKRKYTRHPHPPNSDSESSEDNSLELHSSTRLDPPPPPPSSRSPRSPRPYKYTFNLQLSPEYDANQRVMSLLNTLQEMRSIYASLKNQLAAIDRRRKKLRRRERENMMETRMH